MSARLPLALTFALLAAPLAAEPWKEVDKLPGDIAVEIDEDSVFDAIDGDRLVTEATFRRSLSMGIMESYVLVDCARNLAKIRRVKLYNDQGVLADNVGSPGTELEFAL